MDYNVEIGNVEIETVVLIGNRLWTVVSKGTEMARLLTFDPPPRGWTTDFTSQPFDTRVAVLTPEEAAAWKATPERVVIEIALGNDAMQSRADVFDAIRRGLLVEDGLPVASLVPLEQGEGGSLRDANGNTTGKWEVF